MYWQFESFQWIFLWVRKSIFCCANTKTVSRSISITHKRSTVAIFVRVHLLTCSSQQFCSIADEENSSSCFRYDLSVPLVSCLRPLLDWTYYVVLLFGLYNNKPQVERTNQAKQSPDTEARQATRGQNSCGSMRLGYRTGGDCACEKGSDAAFTREGLQCQVLCAPVSACVHQNGVVSPAVNAGVSWQASIQIDSDSTAGHGRQAYDRPACESNIPDAAAKTCRAAQKRMKERQRQKERQREKDVRVTFWTGLIYRKQQKLSKLQMDWYMNDSITIWVHCFALSC